jgi:hypothetical protein
MGPVKNGVLFWDILFILGYFSTKLGTPLDGHEQLIIT